jgi:predicted transcriptional regulator
MGSTPKRRERLSRAASGFLLSEAAELLQVSPATVRRHIKGGKLAASQVMGKFGPEYRIAANVLKTFALDAMGILLDEEQMEGVKRLTHRDATPPPSESVEKLYERLLELTEQATRYRTLSELSESTLRAQEEDYKRQIAELLLEKKALEERIQNLEERKRWSLFRRRGSES